MENTKDLHYEEGVRKIKKIIDKIRICMFCTKIKDVPFRTRPMATLEVDDEGQLWFFSNKESNKNDEIENEGKVQLLYQSSDSHFLTITGDAEIVHDQMKVDNLWNSMAKTWFPEGKNDPNLIVIKVAPREAHYWDTINGKMSTLLKKATSAMTGKPAKTGVEGKIKVS